MTRLEIVSAFAFVLFLLQLALARGVVGTTELVLLGLAAVGFVFRDVEPVLRRLRKVKWGDFEAELDQEILKFEEKVVAAEYQATRPAGQPKRETAYAPLHDRYVAEYEQIVSGSASPREKIMLAGLLVERMIVGAVKELDLKSKADLTPKAGMELLVANGFVTPAEAEALAEFWRVRNLVLHSQAEQLSDRQLSNLLALVWRMVTVFG